ncbi:MAG TPA: class I SAM-dependent RNA methyltransferase [Thermodesulfobacteriaceae bacterium]|nr:class I SAM-dependent RNA methyltransferase [Thermodesulfobacteriaceae bacterium]
MTDTSPLQTSYWVFAACPPGLEDITAKEIENLGISGSPEPGGIEFRGSLREIYLANLMLRTASRILVRLGTFKATSFRTLVQRISRYPWELYVHHPGTLKLRVSCSYSRLYHTRAIEQRVHHGISLRLQRKRPGPHKGQTHQADTSALVIVRFLRDSCTVSIDSSGEHLHRRGYRIRSVLAPLRENLAAAMLLTSGWTPDMPLIDPFCGSGTIPIEAAMMAKGIPPGSFRSFAFEKWRNFDRRLWTDLKKQSVSLDCSAGPVIIASDRSPKALSAVAQNAEKAGVSDSIQIINRPVSKLSPPIPGPGWIICNPPYGKRIGQEKAVIYMFQTLGRVVRERFPGWRLALLCPHYTLQRALALRMEKVTAFSNGGVHVELLRQKPTTGVELGMAD